MPYSTPPGRWSAAPDLPVLPQLRRPDGGPWLALLADDNAINREVGAAMLQVLGVEVHTAQDGHEVLGMAAAARYDLVLMDLQMPRLDGLAATRSLRALPGMATLPVIAVTANSSDQSRLACQAAGMNAFVTKPIDIWQLADTLQRCLPQP
jgi:CheY-like chemotaxis protein